MGNTWITGALTQASLQVPLALVGGVMLPIEAHNDSHKLTVSKHKAALSVAAVNQYRCGLERDKVGHEPLLLLGAKGHMPNGPTPYIYDPLS